MMASAESIQKAADLLRAAKHAVALTGAGHSTASGIPDFRSPESGLWEKYDPMVVASIQSFLANPRLFYDWIRPLARQTAEAKPNPAHYALARLEAQGILKAVITQNIDDLHTQAGSRRVLELHGNLRTATCVRCGKKVASEPIVRRFLEEDWLPTCECGGAIKPDVVLFGEMLPVDVFMAADAEARACDVMLVAGSSLEVYPAADLPFVARQHGARLIIVNLQPTPADGVAEVVIHDNVAVVLPRIADLCI